MSNDKVYMNEYMKKRYAKRRLDALALLGGKCVECDSKDNLEIDHIVYKDKSFSLSKALSGWAWDRIEKELVKCQILCDECHMKKTRKDLAEKFNQREHWEHGTITGYAKKKCRCEQCKDSWREYQKEYRNKK